MRPPANAIDLGLAEELQAAIREADGRPDVGALVLTGGPTIFAAGADIKAMATWGPEEVRPSVDALGDGLRPARGDRHDLDRGDQRLRAWWRVRARPRLRPALRGDRRDAGSAGDRPRCDPGRRRDPAAGAARRAGTHPRDRLQRQAHPGGGGAAARHRRARPRTGGGARRGGRGRAAVRRMARGSRSPLRRRRSARRSARPAPPVSRPSGRPSWRCSARPISARGWRRSWRSASPGSAADRRSNSRHIRSISLSHLVTTVRAQTLPRRRADRE